MPWKNKELLCVDEHREDLRRSRVYRRDCDVNTEIMGLVVMRVSAQEPHVGLPRCWVDNGIAEVVSGRITILDENFMCEAKLAHVGIMCQWIWSGEYLDESHRWVPVLPGVKDDDVAP